MKRNILLVVLVAAVSLCAAVLVFLVVGGGEGPNSASTAAQTPPAPPVIGDGRRVVFDVAHGEVFGPEDASELGQSLAVQRMRDAGFEVEVNRAALTTASLAGAAALYLPGPMRGFSTTEATAIESYVRDGGNVVLTAHVPFPILGFAKRFGVEIVPAVLMSEQPAPGAPDRSIFRAKGMADDPLTEGIGAVEIVSGWPLHAVGRDALVVVSTGPEVWADRVGDGARGADEPQGPLGVVAVTRIGLGSVVVAGDDAIFANIGIVQSDNARLLDNILGRIEKRTRPI